MIVVTLKQVGDEVVLVLNEELRALLGGVKAGDVLVLNEAAGGVTVAAERTEHDRQVELGRALIQRYRKTFEALAK